MSVAAPDSTRLRMPPQPKGGRLRCACASFWLNGMFYGSRVAPRAVRHVKGFFLWGAWGCSRHLQEETILNAKHLLGEGSTIDQRRALGREVVGSFYDFICEIGRTTKMGREQLLAQIAEISGKERYLKMREAKKGAIIATAHMGSFEVGMAAVQVVESHINVVFQRDSFPLFERLRSEFRNRLGIKEAAVDDGWAMWMRLRDALQADEVVAIQADRVMPGQVGVKVPFLDGHSLFPEGPAKLAAITGSPIVPVFTVRQADGRVRIFIEEAIWVEEASEAAIASAIAKIAEVVGRYVQQYPEQWLVVNRAWCEDIAPTTATAPART